MLALAAVHLALATGRLDGRIVLGRSLAQVEASFGKPLAVERYPVRRDLRYRGFEVIFGNGRTASALLATDPAVALPPAAMRSELRAVTALREERRYRCDKHGCFGTFFTANGTRRVIYGVSGGRPYVGEQVWPQP